ncbi:VOC family protein [Streptomyces sp. NL15-2K]|uniref:VOC family protein n=1 Tax=Streptomyces sp. NL15-2K TaxID=376149 RepID=UPI000F58AB26|nr:MULTISPECIES: VOC family protein [Actinomycetes]WKX08089.1 VOC family protein [Kutzneria buriramensis]GCB50456.1 merR family transcriptional regulator [Streptomyces sp. NL15-2K]
MLSIGSFSLVTGLSITALRHYDDVGLLKPAYVDPDTGYRRYRPDQVDEARLYAALRRIQVPVDAMRAVGEHGVGAVLAEHRERLQARADSLTKLIETVDRYMEKGLPVKTRRISQVTIVADDLPASVAFYRDAFDAAYHQEISSFQFGTYPDDDFFLLTVANPESHPWPGGPAKFGLGVEDIDATHARALAAGAVEIGAPVDRPWKPRSSTVQDPGGNHIDLYQA